MDGSNFWQKLFDSTTTLTLDGLKTLPNNHTIDYFSAQPEDSQGKNRAEINGNDHERFIHLSAQPGFSEDLSTADTDFEVNDNNHHALDSLQVQPGSCGSSTNKATTDLLFKNGLKTVPNNHTIDYFSAQPEDSQGKNRAEINGNDHQRFIHLSAQPGFSEDLSTADTDFEVNDNNHHALDSLQVQPGSHGSSTNKATTDLEMSYKSHQTFDYMSAQQGSFKAPETSCPNNRRRKSPEGFDFLKSEKKRMADKAYREKCKEEREITKAENNRLKTEINRLKEESDRKDHSLKSQEEEIKHLQQKVRQLEGSLGQQNVVLEVLTAQLGRSQNIDLQRENTLLKCRLDQLTSCAKNKDSSIILQLQESKEQLQRDKSTLGRIVEALCLKINNDKNQDEEHAQ